MLAKTITRMVYVLVDRFKSAHNRLFTADHDANIAFGIEAPQVYRKVFIQR